MTDLSTAHGDARSYRLSNIDMLRGLVIIIMALDHVRDFFYFGGIQDPMADPNISAGIYLTRWVTHFCAPAFIFLAGTSVGLMADRWERKKLAKFVFKRGLWLIFIEVTLITTAYTFHVGYDPVSFGFHLVILQVIWVIGACMVILSGLLFLGARICLLLGIIIILGDNLLDPIWPKMSTFDALNGIDNPLWATLHTQISIAIGKIYISISYPLLSWAGVMMVGFGSAFIFKKKPAERDAYLIKCGLIMIALFVILRSLNFYGEPNEWIIQEAGFIATFFDFMNVSKYPPSLMFLLATLGPAAIFCAYADKWNGWIKDTLVMFGRVPFLFYIAHFYLIHALSVLLGMWQGFEAHQFMHYFSFFPEGYGTNLFGVYMVWGLVIAIMYPLCKWMANIKQTRKDWWLSYL